MPDKNTIEDDSPARLPAGLYIVATPIGNLGDITLRALDTLRRANHICCEDTRTSRTLLTHYGIKTTLASYHEHNAADMRPRILQWITAGEAVALISDAGTPLISDPGYKLVVDCQAAGHMVTTLPGACAVIAALTLGGLPTDSFFFGGFIPTKTKAKADMFARHAPYNSTLLYYESANRIGKTLTILAEHFSGRDCRIVREITKKFEDVIAVDLSNPNSFDDIATRTRGEVVVMLAPPLPASAPTAEEVDACLRDAFKRGLSVKDAASDVAASTGLPRKALYAQAQALKDTAKGHQP